MDQNNPNDLLNDDMPAPKMTTGLKVLTILTFIGCALQAIGGVWNYFSIEESYKNIDKVVKELNSPDVPAWAKSLAGDPDTLVALITKAYENRIPMTLLTLVAAGLCLYGALLMRKLKKQGFLVYTIGELLPFLSTMIFIGAIGFSGIIFYISVCIALLFILMYALQRKNLVY